MRVFLLPVRSKIRDLKTSLRERKQSRRERSPFAALATIASPAALATRLRKFWSDALRICSIYDRALSSIPPSLFQPVDKDTRRFSELCLSGACAGHPGKRHLRHLWNRHVGPALEACGQDPRYTDVDFLPDPTLPAPAAYADDRGAILYNPTAVKLLQYLYPRRWTEAFAIVTIHELMHVWQHANGAPLGGRMTESNKYACFAEMHATAATLMLSMLLRCEDETSCLYVHNRGVGLLQALQYLTGVQGPDGDTRYVTRCYCRTVNEFLAQAADEGRGDFLASLGFVLAWWIKFARTSLPPPAPP